MDPEGSLESADFLASSVCTSSVERSKLDSPLSGKVVEDINRLRAAICGQKRDNGNRSNERSLRDEVYRTQRALWARLWLDVGNKTRMED